MRRVGRWFARLLALVAALLVAGTLVPRPLLGGAAGGDQPTHHILVLASRIHTDIAVPIDLVRAGDFDFLRQAGLPIDHPDARWVLFGWGGKSFYVATPELTDIQLVPLIKSFGLDESVMHVQVTAEIVEPQPFVAGFDVTEAGMQRMIAFIRAGFAEPNGTPVRIEGAGYGAGDAFYEALGSFNAIVGCNTWTAAALREAGLRTGWWSPLPQTLGWSLALYN